MRIYEDAIMNFNSGDIFYECESGYNMEFKITVDPKESTGSDGKKVWIWEGINTKTGKQISFLVTEGFSHYGPKIYDQPEYFRMHDGEVIFDLV